MCQAQSYVVIVIIIIILIILSFSSNVKQMAFMKPFSFDSSEASPYASFQLFPAILVFKLLPCSKCNLFLFG